MSDCRDCGGTRHVQRQEEWVPCRCLIRERRRRAYRKAGLAARFDGVGWRDLFDCYEVGNRRALLETAKTLGAGGTPSRWVLVYGKASRARRLVGTLLLRAACDGSAGALWIEVPGLIDAEFQPGRGREVYRTAVLGIDLGEEPANKWNRTVLEKAARLRWADELFTVMVSSLAPDRIGTNYRSNSLARVATEALRVRVGSKE